MCYVNDHCARKLTLEETSAGRCKRGAVLLVCLFPRARPSAMAAATAAVVGSGDLRDMTQRCLTVHKQPGAPSRGAADEARLNFIHARPHTGQKNEGVRTLLQPFGGVSA